MKQQFIAAVIAAAVALPIAAQAENSYVGVSVGRAELKATTPGFSKKETTTGYKLVGGFNFDKTFGVEVGYADLGKIEGSGGGYSVSGKAKSFYVAGTATLPVSEEFAVFGKLGFAANRVDLHITTPTMLGDGNSSKTAPFFGLGASYNFTKTVAVVAEYENFGKVASEQSTDLKGNMFSVGLRYNF